MGFDLERKEKWRGRVVCASVWERKGKWGGWVLRFAFTEGKKKKKKVPYPTAPDPYPNVPNFFSKFFFLLGTYPAVPRRTQRVPVPRTYRVRVLFTKARTRASQASSINNTENIKTKRGEKNHTYIFSWTKSRALRNSGSISIVERGKPPTFDI